MHIQLREKISMNVDYIDDRRVLIHGGYYVDHNDKTKTNHEVYMFKAIKDDIILEWTKKFEKLDDLSLIEARNDIIPGDAETDDRKNLVSLKSIATIDRILKYNHVENFGIMFKVAEDVKVGPEYWSLEH